MVFHTSGMYTIETSRMQLAIVNHLSRIIPIGLTRSRKMEGKCDINRKSLLDQRLSKLRKPLSEGDYFSKTQDTRRNADMSVDHRRYGHATRRSRQCHPSTKECIDANLLGGKHEVSQDGFDDRQVLKRHFMSLIYCT